MNITEFPGSVNKRAADWNPLIGTVLDIDYLNRRILPLTLASKRLRVSVLYYGKVLHFKGTWGGVVVKALRYYSDGPGIDCRWCHWGFFPWYPRQNHVPWGRLSLWKWVPGFSPGVKAAGAYGWRPTTLVVLNVKKIRDLNVPEPLWSTSACCGRPLLFFTTF